MSNNKAMNTFKALRQLKPPDGGEYTVLAYFLVDNPKDVYGLYIPLGHYGSKEDAIDRATEIIKSTGHDAVIATKTCDWRELSTKSEVDRINIVPIGLDDALTKKFKDEQEKRNKLRDSIEEKERKRQEYNELVKEPDSIGAHADLWNRLQNNADENDKCNKRIIELKEENNNIRDLIEKHPEYEGKWFDLYHKYHENE